MKLIKASTGFYTNRLLYEHNVAKKKKNEPKTKPKHQVTLASRWYQKTQHFSIMKQCESFTQRIVSGFEQ